jgi:multimeric flavodoxin WrbA
MANVIGIIGSYREGGVNDQAVTEMLAGAAEAGAATRRVFLPEVEIQFCTNCRACMQEPGEARGRCVLGDAMNELFDACVQADGIVLASPHNMGSVTAIYKRFLERFAPLGYWPWGAPAPKNRTGIPKKAAVLVTSAAAPAFFWRLAGYSAEATLRYTAKMLNAKVLRVLKYGMVGMAPQPTLTEQQRATARVAGRRLVVG